MVCSSPASSEVGGDQPSTSFIFVTSSTLRQLPFHAILLAIRIQANLQHFFREAIRFDGRVQRARPEILFPHVAGDVARVGARRTDGHEALDVMPSRSVE